jgi:subtilisin family serine protease
VIDSGMDRDHPDLAANAWTNPGESGFGRESNGLDDDLNGRIDDWRGWDFVANDSNPADENGHGTHVAGTIGARRDNSVGVAGVADGSRLMPLRVLNAQGNGSVAGVILAYAYAARAGAKVVNLSLGAQAFSRAEQDAILAFPGMLFVAAAGNGGSDGIGDDNDLSPEYPCAYILPNVLCVAATDNRDRLASFSNYGDVAVDLGAPGVDILSTTPGGGYGWASGTSMATPHVAGAAALLWAASPGASVAQVKSALMTGADPVASLSGRTVTGARLNVLGSLRLVADITLTPAAPDPAPPEEADDADEETAPAPAPPPRRRVVPEGTVAGDATPPHLSVSISRRHRIGRLARRGLPVRVRCSEACTASVRLRAGRGVSGTARAQVAAGRGRHIVVRLGRSARARLSAAAPRRARLTIAARDRAGNRRTVTLSVQLRR